MSEAKLTDFILFLVLVQVSSVLLKLSAIGQAANWSWIAVFSPTWFPVVLAATFYGFYLLIRTLFPEKKKQATYTSTRWQERLAEVHSAR